MSFFLLQTKFYIPTSRPELVSRARLIEQLNRGLRRKLTLVSAPAGFGKTTLLSDWSRHSELPFAWLSLDEADNDLKRFLFYFVAALQTVPTGNFVIGEAVAEALQAPQLPPVEALLAALINDIVAASKEFVLVLDDYHLIESPQVDQALGFLLNHAPPQCHLAIATRVDPSLPLSRLRARGQLTELRTAELRFTPDEAAHFLKLVTGLEISAADVAALEARTEGWIAGLQLAALSMQGMDDISGFIQSFTGTHRYIIDYLADEVLLQCSEPVKSFLLHTSILNRLCADLCNALTGQSDGQALLQQLEQANLFLVPLDNQRRWYRYHHLFADLLRQRLQDNVRFEQIANLHKRASQWYEAQGLFSEALYHALATAAPDFERAERLITSKVTEKIMQGEISTVSEWLQALPEEVVHESPVLCVSKAWIYYFLHQYEEIEPLLELVEQKNQQLSLTSVLSFADLQSGTMVLRAFIANQKGEVSQAIQLLRQSLAHLPAENIFARGMTSFFLANTLFYSGNTREASQLYPEAIKLCLAAGNMLAATGAIQSLAMSQLTQGRLHQAKTTLLNALTRLATPNKSPLLAMGFLYLGLGEVQYQQNNLAEALQSVQKGLELLSRGGALMVGFGYLILANILHALGNRNEARKAVQQAETYYRKMDSGSRDAIYGATSHARCLLLFGELERVAQWAQDFSIHPSKPLTYQSELQLMTFAHFLLAQHATEPTRFSTHLSDALTLLDNLYHNALKYGRMGRFIEICILKALAYAAQKHITRALNALEEALTLAEPEGFVRVFVDKGQPMAVLLYEAAARGIKPRYIGGLLAAFPDIDPISPPQPTSKNQNQTPPTQLIEPLSERELEVLHLIADGLTNREIANQLILSLNTIKGHTRKIYGKLGVNSRTQAIGKARAFGLLTAV